MYKTIDKLTEKRLNSWRSLRRQLEISSTPFDDVVNFFNQFPKVKIYTDPYDQSSWPTAWELIEENQYCPFNIILGICYTLQMCKKFENQKPKITITIDKNDNSIYYLLFISNKVYGYKNFHWIDKTELSNSLRHIKIYNMLPVH